jgi:Tfp pilus assembly protein PilV
MARGRTGRRGGFTLIEILVAVLLLSGSLVAMMALWSVSRRMTERSRDTAEYYAIARQEAERDRALGFNGIFNAPGFANNSTRYTDYDPAGTPLATVTSFAAAPTAGAYYRARSAYSLVITGSTAANSPESLDPAKRLGVQVIEVFPITGHAGNPPTGTAVERSAIYQTTLFFAQGGV